ncbi:hypothetical protein fugu_002615 [Takifugu bimaculatus]|uniref:Bcl-2 Bcl-2 homology region 1-3 domain-containing protein n=1 Tax=Takifugu bimaculatus TaxID=433685 RepID=A0A4Z2BFL9_9TELE|nr:hypothetical protein fugu_002615 [Takifugu bimaculatus]
MSCGLWKETLALAEDYLSLCSTSQCPAPPPPSESATAMRHLGQDMEKQHQARFNSLAQTFLRQCGPDLCSSLRKVMEELVGDGHLNWGRVVSLFTFTWGAGQTDAGAEEHKAGAGPWTRAATGTGARKLQGTRGDHSRLSRRGEERLAAGEWRMGGVL